jgi:PAS domain S-box-containing protein
VITARRLGLRAVLVSLFVGQAAAAVGIVGWVAWRTGQEAIRNTVTRLSAESSARVRQQLDDYLELPHRLIEFAGAQARRGALSLDDPEGLVRRFWDQGEAFPGIGTMAFANEQGEFFGANRPEDYVVVASRAIAGGAIRRYRPDREGRRTAAVLSERPGYDARERPWYRAAVAAGRPAWAGITASVTTQRLDLSAVTPYRDAAGELRGVFLVDLSLARINEFLRKIPVGHSGSIFVVERNGLLVATSRPGPTFAVGPGPAPQASRLEAAGSSDRVVAAAARAIAGHPAPAAGEPGSRGLAFSLDGVRHFLDVTAYRKEPGIDWLVAVVIPESEFSGLVEAASRRTLAAILVGLIVAVGAGTATARWLTGPILRLNASARALAEGNWEAPLPAGRADEVGELSESFGAMRTRLRDLVARLEREVVERREAETALSRSEEKYRTIFEESRDMLFVSTPQGRFLDINPAGVRLLGCATPAEALALDIPSRLYASPADRARLLSTLAREGLVRDFETTFRRRDDADVAVSITATAVRDAAGAVTLLRGIVRDETERRRLEGQLRQAQKMEAVGQLAGGIAHDFNNILTAVIGYAHLLGIRLPHGDPRQAEVGQIVAAAERAATLTRGLLAFSRKQIIDPRPVAVNAIVERLLPMLSRLLREDVEIATDLWPGDTTVRADVGQIEQVLVNLATNGSDAMPGGGVLRFRTGTAVRGGAPGAGEHPGAGRYVTVTVSDAGPGMDEGTRERVFEPFFTTKEIGKGTGLGLSVAYGIVRQHGGFIEVESAPGRGTSFTVLLPVASGAAEADAAAAPDAAGPETHPGGTETLLVAEDDATVRGLVREVLEQSGYRVLLARDGEEAWEIWRERRGEVRLLLLDLVMPRLDGRALLRRVREEAPEVPALFMSGYTATIASERAALGTELLLKPVPVAELLRKVREVLDRSASGASGAAPPC